MEEHSKEVWKVDLQLKLEPMFHVSTKEFSVPKDGLTGLPTYFELWPPTDLRLSCELSLLNMLPQSSLSSEIERPRFKSDSASLGGVAVLPLA